MASHFLLELDTTAPALRVRVSQGVEESLAVFDLTTDVDVADVKLWGSIDPGDPGNANYAETFGDADWFVFDRQLIVRIAPGGGRKIFSLQVRDDVWNESQRVTVEFGVVEPPVVPPAPPTPGWPLDRPPEPEIRRVFESHSRTAVISTTALSTDMLRVIDGRSAIALISSAIVSRGRTIERPASRIAIVSRSGSSAFLPSPASVVALESDSEIVKRRGHADDEAILALLFGS